MTQYRYTEFQRSRNNGSRYIPEQSEVFETIESLWAKLNSLYRGLGMIGTWLYEGETMGCEAFPGWVIQRAQLTTRSSAVRGRSEDAKTLVIHPADVSVQDVLDALRSGEEWVEVK